MNHPPIDPVRLDAVSHKLTRNHYAVLRSLVDHKAYKDIAAEMAIPLGTVRSRVNRARAAFAKATTPQEPATNV